MARIPHLGSHVDGEQATCLRCEDCPCLLEGECRTSHVSLSVNVSEIETIKREENKLELGCQWRRLERFRCDGSHIDAPRDIDDTTDGSCNRIS
jgi:hypothetical protein